MQGSGPFDPGNRLLCLYKLSKTTIIVKGTNVSYGISMQYAFILGRNAKLSAAEIKSVLPKGEVVYENDVFLVLEHDVIDAVFLMKRLGGTIKIAKIVSEKVDKELIVQILLSEKNKGKLNFGVSYYCVQQDNLGMQIKGELKKRGISCRLVVGKEKALSSVIVTKNNVVEFLNLDGKFIAQTLAVQDFEEYSHRDFGRPIRDMKSGSMPPKLAQVMINLCQANKDDILLDPFCGSGTVITEALLLGFNHIIGTDKSAKAIEDTIKNVAWFKKEYEIYDVSPRIEQVDVRVLSREVANADAIVTEPYLGPALLGEEQELEIEKIVAILAQLYLEAFEEFKKVVAEKGSIVIIFPSWKAGKKIFHLNIEKNIEDMGFTREDDGSLVYSRPDQRVYRNIRIFRKN